MQPTALSRQIVHTGWLFSVERIELAADDGGPTMTREVVRHPGAVAVVPVLDDGRLVLIRNYRIAVEDWLLELCAGKLEAQEDPAAAARRELEEETGHAAEELESLGTFYTSPGFADEIMHVFEARQLRTVPRRLERGEHIEVVTMSVEELFEAIAAGRIRDGKTLAGLLLWLRRRRP